MNTKLVIQPLEGLNDLKFGMDRHTVHSLIGNPTTVFYKHADDPHTSEEYHALCIFIYYDNMDLVSGFEAWAGAELYYEDMAIFRTGYDDLLSFFLTIDSSVKVLSDGFISYANGVTAWYEDDISYDSICTSFTVFKKGFFDELNARYSGQN